MTAPGVIPAPSSLAWPKAGCARIGLYLATVVEDAIDIYCDAFVARNRHELDGDPVVLIVEDDPHFAQVLLGLRRSAAHFASPLWILTAQLAAACPRHGDVSPPIVVLMRSRAALSLGGTKPPSS